MNLAPEPTRHSNPFECLVIQTAGMTELLQSLMALRAAKTLYPGLEISLLTNENLAPTVSNISWIKNVYVLPEQKFLTPVLSGQRTPTQVLGDLARWISPLVEKRWEFLINWSFSESSSYIAALLPAKIKLGYSRRPDLSFCAIDGWSHYVLGIQQGSILQNIHRVDILTTQMLTAFQIHIGEAADPGESPLTSRSFFDKKIRSIHATRSFSWMNSSKKWLAVQVTGFEPKALGAIILSILKKHADYRVILLGDQDDEVLGDQVIGTIPTDYLERSLVMSLVGETVFDDWADALAKCTWLLTKSSASSQLASLLGVRVFFVTNNIRTRLEEGPYGNGHYVLESLSPLDPPSLLYNTWAFANTDWNLKSKKSLHKSLEAVNLNEYFSKVQIYKSRIRSLEEGGGVAYDPSLPCALVLDDWSSMAFGDVARAWYCGWVPKTGNELNRAALTPSLLNEIRKMGEVLIEVRSRIQKSRQIANSLSKFTRGLKSQAIMRLTDRKEIHDLGRDLNILEMEISQLCQPHTVLRALSKMAEVLMHNLRGESLKELSLEAAVSYTQLEEGVEILNTWVKHTLDLARPRSLKNENRLTTVADLRG